MSDVTYPSMRRGLMLGANLHSALQALLANRTRSLLTMLGIIIGVAAVISVVTLTQAVSDNITQRFTGLGTNTLTIYSGSLSRGGASGGQGTSQSLTLSDVQAVAQVPHITNISPVNSTSAQLIYGSQNWNTRVQGVYPSEQSLGNWQLAEGSWFSQGDSVSGASVVVLGQTVATNLFSASGSDALGQTIHINNQIFRVVGVLQTKGTQGSSNSDDVAYVPFVTAQGRFKNTGFVDQIQTQVDDVNNVAQVQQTATSVLEKQHHIQQGAADDFRIFSSNQLVQTAQQATVVLTTLLVGIAAISLTVGGIGIMNIMLVSVTERTREIGIRMAIGARRGDVRNQFLIEALTLSVVGGIIGILIGLLGGLALTSGFHLAFSFSLQAILIAFGVSAIIGVVFGLYPAVRASQLDPIVALRTE